MTTLRKGRRQYPYVSRCKRQERQNASHSGSAEKEKVVTAGSTSDIVVDQPKEKPLNQRHRRKSNPTTACKLAANPTNSNGHNDE